MLRRLTEHGNYSALRAACLDADLHDPRVQVLLALAHIELGDASGRSVLASLDRAALTLDARVDLAAVYMALGELDPAVEILETAREQDADDALALARLGWCRLQQGQRDQALALYERSLSLRPSLAAYQNLLLLYRDSGRLADMARCLDAASRFWSEDQIDWPDDARQRHSRQLRGLQLDVWLAEERFEAAEAWVERQRETLDEDDWCALLAGLAQRLAARDRNAEAEEWLRTGLRRYPENHALYGELSELVHLQGRAQQAIALLGHAIRLASEQNKSTEGSWIRLSKIALRSNPGLAREAAERAREELARRSERSSSNANEIAEGRSQLEVALAAVEAHQQDYGAAEQRYRCVLALRPTLVPALEGLGQLFMQLGRIDEAVVLFERVEAIDPTRGQAALINARRFPNDDETLIRLEQLARTPRTDSSLRTGLLFQLAAAWEQREGFAKAFALADEANAAARRLLRYDPKAHRQHCARICHAFPKALYQHRPGCAHETTLPVFVVGMPRSGTTLVEQIIAGHSKVHGAGELGTIPRVIARLERWERNTGSGRHFPDCVDDLDPDVTRGIAESVLKELQDSAPDADHVVDKLPHNFENIGLIRLLFPRAKIISVRRDPRDIAISNYFIDYVGKHGGMGFAYDLAWIGAQLADHAALMQHWHKVFPGEILEIQYESVVDDPETSARRMLDYIGVDWEPQVLDFYALKRPVKTASVWQVRQPLYVSSKGRWRRYREHLKPLIAATNAQICPEPIEMVTLPEPGWLNVGVDCYRRGDLDAAEYRFKQLLHYLPEHAGARFMLGLVYIRKGHRGDGIALMEQALERCPWNRHWRSDLVQAYRLVGRDLDVATLGGRQDAEATLHQPADAVPAIGLDYLFLSRESTCSSSGSAVSGAPR